MTHIPEIFGNLRSSVFDMYVYYNSARDGQRCRRNEIDGRSGDGGQKTKGVALARVFVDCLINTRLSHTRERDWPVATHVWRQLCCSLKGPWKTLPFQRDPGHRLRDSSAVHI